jgi:hypothetical protein
MDASTDAENLRSALQYSHIDGRMCTSTCYSTRQSTNTGTNNCNSKAFLAFVCLMHGQSRIPTILEQYLPSAALTTRLCCSALLMRYTEAPSTYQQELYTVFESIGGSVEPPLRMPGWKLGLRASLPHSLLASRGLRFRLARLNDDRSV